MFFIFICGLKVLLEIKLELFMITNHNFESPVISKHYYLIYMLSPIIETKINIEKMYQYLKLNNEGFIS